MSERQQRLAFCPKIYAIENVHNSETLPSVNENYPFLREKLVYLFIVQLMCSYKVEWPRKLDFSQLHGSYYYELTAQFVNKQLKVQTI